MQSALPSKKGLIVAACLFVGIVLIGETQAPTSLTSDRTIISAVTSMLILATPAIAVGALTGRGGILSLGHSFFFLVGAFGATLWAQDINLFGWHPVGLWSFVLAAIFGAIAGAIVALATARLRPFFLTLATFALALLIPSLEVSFPSLFGRGASTGNVVFKDLAVARGNPFLGEYYMAAIIFAIAAFVLGGYLRSERGRAMGAIRDDSLSAEGVGIRVTVRRTEFFALTCSLTAMAGALAAHRAAETSVQLVAVQQSFEFVIAAFLGGINHLFGGLFGAVLLRAKDLSSAGTGPSQWLGDHTFAVLGLMGLAIPPLLTNPRVKQWFRSMFAKNRAPESDTVETPPTAKSGEPDGASATEAPPELGALAQEELASVSAAKKAAVAVKDAPRPEPQGRVLLEAKDIGLHFGGLAALDGVSLTLRAGEVVGLIGPNGSGKSSFINVMAGIYHHQHGHLTLNGEDVDKAGPAFRSRAGIARTYQNVRSWPGLTPREHIMVAAGAKAPVDLASSLLTLPTSVSTTKKLSARAQELADSVGLDRIDGTVDNYSMPSLRRLEIARALAVEPSVLLLDEPAAGMRPDDLPQLVELVGRLRNPDRAIVLVEHHMDVIEATVDRIIVLDQGQLLASGDMETIKNDPAVREAYLG